MESRDARNLNVSRFEITAVYTHQDAKADIVLVHGLNGHPKETWTSKDGTFWPLDLLPESLREQPSNILVYGYNADVYATPGSHSASSDFILHHAQTLVATLTAHRIGTASAKRPIIWVAHSLGGILVKRALLYSSNLRAPHDGALRSIYVSTYGIIFLGTPHTGSDLATWGRVLEAMARAAFPKRLIHTESVLLKTLKANSERLHDINSSFLGIQHRFKIVMAHECQKTRLWFTRIMVVERSSAAPLIADAKYYGIEATHSGMCKFTTATAPGYRLVSTGIEAWVGEADRTISDRWVVEKRDRQNNKSDWIREMEITSTPDPTRHIRRNLQDTSVGSSSSLPLGASPYLTDSTFSALQRSPSAQYLLDAPESAGFEPSSEPDAALPMTLYKPTPSNFPGPTVSQGTRSSLQTIDESIIAFNADRRFPSRPGKVFGIPYPRNRWFTGRESTMREIEDLLVHQTKSTREVKDSTDASSLSIFVVHGLPGIGKTHLAVEFGYRQKKSFSHVFWVSADNEEKLDQGLVGMARSLGLASDIMIEEKEKMIEAALGWLKSESVESNWLLILDNVDDAQILNPLWSDLHHGSVLITSRDQVIGAAAVTPSSRSSRLVQLSISEGRDFVKRRMEQGFRDAIDDSSAADLAQRLGLYPLYMDTVMSLVQSLIHPSSSASSTLREFLEQLQSEPTDHELQKLGADNPWYTNSVAKAIGAHLTKFGTSKPQARDVLSIIAFLDPDSIPQQLLLSADGKVPSLSSGVKQKMALGQLIGSSFIYLDLSDPKLGKRIHLHRLVRDAALRSELEPQRAFDAAVSLLRKSFPLHGISRDHMVENWAECEAYQPHVLALHGQYLEFRKKRAVSPTFEFIELAYSCAWYLCERGRFALGKKIIATIYEDYKILLGSNTTVPRVFLADIYTVQLYHYNESDHGVKLIDLANQALEIREDAVKKELMKPSHPNRANSFMNLGVVLALEDPRKAIKQHSKALKIRHMSDEYRDVQIHGFALNYLNIGRCWWVLGELETAALCFEQCLLLWKKREAKLGKKFSLTAWAMLALGIVRADQGDYDVAAKLMSESLELHIQIMGERHLKTQACCYRLGWLCLKIGELRRACQVLTICHETYSALPDPPKAELARTKFMLSQALEELGVPRDEYLVLLRESGALLTDVLRLKGVDVSGRDLCEKDYDAQIDYYYR